MLRCRKTGVMHDAPLTEIKAVPIPVLHHDSIP